MSVSQILTALPDPPDPANDTQSEFSTKATAFTLALVTMATELNTLVGQYNASIASFNAGEALSMTYLFSTTTTDADPGAGQLRLNNATQNLATVIRADNADQLGLVASSFIDLFDDSTSSHKGFIMLRHATDPAKFILFNVVSIASPTGYRNITVTVAASSAASPFANGDLLIMSFTRTGDTAVGTETRAAGQCRLTKNGANLLLSPFQGNRLMVNGANVTVPAAGITLAPPATTNTTYYIYAVASAGAVSSLEASTTAPVVDATWGHRVKTGDATRTLVGMARTVSSAWVDTATQRFVISEYNRRPIQVITAAVTVGSMGSVNAERTTANRGEFLSWGDTAVHHGTHGYVTDSAAGSVVYMSTGQNGATASTEVAATVTSSGAFVPNASISVSALPEGYNYVSTHGRSTSGGTGSLTAQNWAVVQG